MSTKDKILILMRMINSAMILCHKKNIQKSFCQIEFSTKNHSNFSSKKKCLLNLVTWKIEAIEVFILFDFFLLSYFVTVHFSDFSHIFLDILYLFFLFITFFFFFGFFENELSHKNSRK